jgi:DNA-binding MarR family transcriptional regulator
MWVPADECAREVLEVVPLIMRTIRMEMRNHRTLDLSVPQFRTLNFLNRRKGATLSEVAEHVGLTAPSMSKMIDGLVERGLVMREMSAVDRRRVTLTLAPLGESVLESTRLGTEARLAERFAALPETDRSIVAQAMEVLRPIFAPGHQQESKALGDKI